MANPTNNVSMNMAMAMMNSQYDQFRSLMMPPPLPQAMRWMPMPIPPFVPDVMSMPFYQSMVNSPSSVIHSSLTQLSYPPFLGFGAYQQNQTPAYPHLNPTYPYYGGYGGQGQAQEDTSGGINWGQHSSTSAVHAPRTSTSTSGCPCCPSPSTWPGIMSSYPHHGLNNGGSYVENVSNERSSEDTLDSAVGGEEDEGEGSQYQDSQNGDFQETAWNLSVNKRQSPDEVDIQNEEEEDDNSPSKRRRLFIRKNNAESDTDTGAINLKMERLLRHDDEDSQDSSSDFGDVDEDNVSVTGGGTQSADSSSDDDDEEELQVPPQPLKHAEAEDVVSDAFDEDDEEEVAVAAGSDEIRGLCSEAIAQENKLRRRYRKKSGSTAEPPAPVEKEVKEVSRKRKRIETTTRSGRTVKRVMPDGKSTSEESSQEIEEAKLKLPAPENSQSRNKKHPKGAFPCSECGKVFKYHSQVRQHEMRHIPKVCDEEDCEFEYKERHEMVIHQISAHGKTKEEIAAARVFECPICSKAFKKSSELQAHRNDHDAEGKYSCPYCSKTFWFWQSRKAHKRGCAKREPYDSSAASSQSVSQRSTDSDKDPDDNEEMES